MKTFSTNVGGIIITFIIVATHIDARFNGSIASNFMPTWNPDLNGTDIGKRSSVASSLSRNPLDVLSRYSSVAHKLWPTRPAQPTGWINGESSCTQNTKLIIIQLKTIFWKQS